MHRSADHALAITRNELNHVILECRGTQNCQYSRIIGALGLTNDRVYAETSDWLISRLSRVPIEAVSLRVHFLRGRTRERRGFGRSPELPGVLVPRRDLAVRSDAWRIGGTRRVVGRDCKNRQRSQSKARLSGTTFWIRITGNTETGDNLDRLGPDPGALAPGLGRRFFRSADGRLFAQVPVGSRHEIYGLKSTAFRDWLIEGYFADCGEIPSQWAIRRVLDRARGASKVRRGDALGLYSRRPRRLGERLALLHRPGRFQWPGHQNRARGVVGRRSTGGSLSPARGAAGVAHTQPGGLDRAAAFLRQSVRSRFPPDDRLDGRGASAGRPVSGPGALRRASGRQEHPGHRSFGC